MSLHAESAKTIRKELKKVFSMTKFSVTSQSYSGGNSIAVEWVDGPTSEEVENIAYKYQYGRFNGMEDIYENTNKRDDLPQVKYVQVRREISEKVKQQVFEELQKTHAYFEEVSSMDECNDNLKNHWNTYTAREYVHRVLIKVNLIAGYKGFYEIAK